MKPNKITSSKAVPEPWAKNLDRVRDGSIEAGLICLAAISKPGDTFNHRDIAYVCGCSHGLVCLIEQRALRKIRKRLLKELGKQNDELFGPDSTLP